VAGGILLLVSQFQLVGTDHLQRLLDLAYLFRERLEPPFGHLATEHS